MFFQTFQQLSCHSTNLVLTLRFYVIASNSKRKPVKFVVFLHTISMQKIMAYTKGALFFLYRIFRYSVNYLHYFKFWFDRVIFAIHFYIYPNLLFLDDCVHEFGNSIESVSLDSVGLITTKRVYSGTEWDLLTCLRCEIT